MTLSVCSLFLFQFFSPLQNDDVCYIYHSTERVVVKKKFNAFFLVLLISAHIIKFFRHLSLDFQRKNPLLVISYSLGVFRHFLEYINQFSEKLLHFWFVFFSFFSFFFAIEHLIIYNPLLY